MNKRGDQTIESTIEVVDVDKSFQIPGEKIDSLKSYLSHPWKFFKKKSAKQFHVLSDISFEVKRGEFIGLVGRNGSGKSTLLKIIAGIYVPDKGTVKVHGKLIPFLELGVGFNPDLSARDNVYLNGTILGMKRKYLKSKMDEILDFAEIKEFANTPIKNFSSGMTVRLAFSIAIQTQADIYLLDEVLAVGDEGFRQKSLKKMKELIKSGVTIVYVSHDLRQVEEISDRVIYIDNGRIKSIGRPKQIVKMFRDDIS